jgi:hypothetical protein
VVRTGGAMRSNSIPKGMLAIYERIVGLTDDVCDRQLNSEYRDLARVMTGRCAGSARAHSLLDNRELGRAGSSTFWDGSISSATVRFLHT